MVISIQLVSSSLVTSRTKPGGVYKADDGDFVTTRDGFDVVNNDVDVLVVMAAVDEPMRRRARRPRFTNLATDKDDEEEEVSIILNA